MKDIANNRRWASLLMLTGLLILVGGQAHAQVDPLWDHYRAYGLAPFAAVTTSVTLEDQFGTFTYNHLERICISPPDKKTHEGVSYPVNNPRLHYSWWRLGEEDFDRPGVQVDNQFGQQLLDVHGSDQYLLTPTLKNPMPGEEIPVANHYKCYSCTGTPPNVPVVLEDQFSDRTALVGAPQWLCNPTKKTIDATGEIYDMEDPDQHYVCYRINGEGHYSLDVISDQFIQNQQIEIEDDLVFCVPSTKHDPTQTEQSTWGSLKSLYR